MNARVWTAKLMMALLIQYSPFPEIVMLKNSYFSKFHSLRKTVRKGICSFSL